MREELAKAIELGDSYGEQAARALVEKGGISAAAATLSPMPCESYATAFYEVWGGGHETWMKQAQYGDLARKKGVHPYVVMHFDRAFARGARRWCEMAVRGYLDARAGVPAELPPGKTVAEVKARMELMKRRLFFGDSRPELMAAYDVGYKLFLGGK